MSRPIAIDFETIKCPKAAPFIPEKGPRDRTDPWEKLCFDSNYIMPCVVAFCDGDKCASMGLDKYSEPEMLAKIWEILPKYNPIVTFNGNNFDIPLLLKRSWYCGVKPTMQLSLRKYDLTGNHIDVRAILGNWDNYARGNIDLYAQLKLGKCKTEGCDGSKVQGMWDAGEYEAVHSYCQQDARITFELFESLRGFYLPE